MDKIAIVGAGLIGRAWAMVFARAGLPVTLWDKAPGVAEAALGLIAEWSFMGPFETIDLNAPGGVADYVERFGPLMGGITEEQTPYDYDAATVERVTEARRAALPLEGIAGRSGWRDRRLMALAAHKKGQGG